MSATFFPAVAGATDCSKIIDACTYNSGGGPSVSLQTRSADMELLPGPLFPANKCAAGTAPVVYPSTVTDFTGAYAYAEIITCEETPMGPMGSQYHTITRQTNFRILTTGVASGSNYRITLTLSYDNGNPSIIGTYDFLAASNDPTFDWDFADWNTATWTSGATPIIYQTVDGASCAFIPPITILDPVPSGTKITLSAVIVALP